MLKTRKINETLRKKHPSVHCVHNMYLRTHHLGQVLKRVLISILKRILAIKKAIHFFVSHFVKHKKIRHLFLAS